MVSDSEWVSISEAAGVLSVSERTVRRRIDRGELESKRDGRRLLVNVAGVVSSEVDTVTEITRLRAEVDKLAALVDNLTGERDYLRSALASALQLQTRAIEAPKDRQWWQFWRSD